MNLLVESSMETLSVALPSELVMSAHVIAYSIVVPWMRNFLTRRNRLTSSLKGFQYYYHQYFSMRSSKPWGSLAKDAFPYYFPDFCALIFWVGWVGLGGMHFNDCPVL